MQRRVSDVECDKQRVLNISGLRKFLDCSGLWPPAEWVPVSGRILVKREELAKRRNMLAEAHKLLGDQRDDASEADMLLHAEWYDALDLRPRILLTPHQQRPGSIAEPIDSNQNDFTDRCSVNIPDRASFNPGFVIHHFGGPTPYPVICQ